MTGPLAGGGTAPSGCGVGVWQMKAGLAELGVLEGGMGAHQVADLLSQQQKPVVGEVSGVFGEGQAQNATRGRMRKR